MANVALTPQPRQSFRVVPVKELKLFIGLFPLILTVLNGDYSREL